MRRSLAILIFATTAVGCYGPASDARFETPESTLETLLGAYALVDVPEAEVQRRLAAHARFTLHDPETFRACFADYGGPHDEGPAGFVLGRLAASKEHVRITRDDDRATARLGSGATLHLRETRGEWKIVLAESVPSPVRAQLHAVYRRSRAQMERAGVLR